MFVSSRYDGYYAQELETLCLCLQRYDEYYAQEQETLCLCLQGMMDTMLRN